MQNPYIYFKLNLSLSNQSSQNYKKREYIIDVAFRNLRQRFGDTRLNNKENAIYMIFRVI